ncbi:hypothetical protein SPONN_901 [uncultured Candidatus Thioglobus sp.]|nr:hypothetical protein SPONN_901 [uncultured Candidatus Thioglobus sp.]
MKSADKAIQSLINDFSKYPNKYLTEDDVRIHLCHLLMPDFGGIEQTKDSDCSISLHTEVRWHGDKHLRYRSDIVLLDVVDMQVTKKKMLELKNHPEKGYAVNKIKGVIEIKFRRNKGDSDNQFFKKIKNDYDKLKEIKDMISTDNENQDTFYSLIVLDKKKDIKSRLNNFPNEIGVRYKFSDKCYKNT